MFVLPLASYRLPVQIFKSIADFHTDAQTVVTLGTFDGVHIGHRKIIERLVQQAKTRGKKSLILTFFPHPRLVLQESSEIRLLNTLDEKIALLAETGLDYLIVHPFDEAFSRLTAAAFVSDVLVQKLHTAKVIIGYDHRFGRNRTADIHDLTRFGQTHGFEVEQISAQEINDVSVSSTKIRSALQEGDIARANQYLGKPYPLGGIVVKGKQIGRTIGFPTANIQVSEPYKLIPQIGIYVVRSQWNGQTLYGMLSIGTNPTVGGTQLSVEVYFLDFDQDLYGQHLHLEILHRLRGEAHFESLDALKAAINQDLQHTLAYLNRGI